MSQSIAASPSPEPNLRPKTTGPKLETFYYDDAIVRKFLVAMFVWGVVAMLVGVIIALMLVKPAWNFGQPYLIFSRLRPLHTNAGIFAFAANGIFAAVYYSTQRLCKARMYSDKLSNLHFWGWQLIIVAAALTLPFGITKGKEYAELEWPIDIAIAIVWLGFFGANFFLTLLHRRERHMYVALWFYIATIVTVTVLHVFNNLVVPIGLFKSYSIYAGAQDAIMQWWYGHNAVAFVLTTPFLGLMYYFLPKAAERPVFSYRLSIVHFWSLVFIYIWAGPHHLHYSAIPDWASTLGMLFSVMLWMPSWGGMINGLLTLRGAWHKVATDPVLKFFVVGITFYGMSTFEGPLLSIKSVNSLGHFTDWVIAHVHGGTLGWVAFMCFGMMYWLLPRLYQTKLYSQTLATLHFWISTVGILLYVLPLYVAGLTEGLMWRAMNDQGQLAFPDYIESVNAVIPMWWMRVFGGSVYLIGTLIGGWNFYMTWRSRPAVYEEVAHTAPRLTRKYTPETAPASKLENVADTGKRIEVFSTFWFHRQWERLPIKFTVLVIIAVVVASLFEIIPTFVIRSNIPIIASVKSYTPLELYGRDIYIREGCYLCHSQMIRPILSEVRRYGEYSKAGEFVYDHPFQWGSRRIGPDLAREGGRQSEIWHVRHFKAPDGIRPGSVMPAFTWLYSNKVDFDSMPSRVQAMRFMGVPYSDTEYYAAQTDAVAQGKAVADRIISQASDDNESKQLARMHLEDKEVTALVAYLQRMGTDLNASPTPTTQPTTAPTTMPTIAPPTLNPNGTATGAEQ